MTNYKIIKVNGKYKETCFKDKAMELMEEMEIGEKFYFNVTKETAKNWCRYFSRKAWNRRLRSVISTRYKLDENDIVRRSNVRDLVEFEVGEDNGGKYIMKTRDKLAYSEEPYNPKHGSKFKLKIDEVNFSVRTHNVLQGAGFKYLEELRTLSKEDRYKYKNMGLKTYKEIRNKLNEIPSLTLRKKNEMLAL